MIKQESTPDLFHAHFTLMGDIGAKLSKKTGVPLVITEHASSMNEKTIPRRLLTCARKGYSLASKVIAVSTPLSNNIYKNTGIDSVVIPNMLSGECFSNQLEKLTKVLDL